MIDLGIFLNFAFTPWLFGVSILYGIFRIVKLLFFRS